MPLSAKHIATVDLVVLFYKLGSWYHYYGGIIPLDAKNIATVLPYLFYILGLWFQCSSDIYLQKYAIYIATVHPSLSYKSGLWYHYLGGIIPLRVNLIATVKPLYSYLLGSCSHSLGGIYPPLAYDIATV